MTGIRERFDRQWDFHKNGDREGWIVPEHALGVVMGGSLWLSLNPDTRDPVMIASPRFQLSGDLFQDLPGEIEPGLEIASPSGLGIEVGEGQQVRVRLRVLNLSPNTDLLVRAGVGRSWWSGGDVAIAAGPWPAGSRCGLRADRKEWQEVVCHLGEPGDVVDDIAIYFRHRIRGDVWIDRIAVDVAPRPAPSPHPDLTSRAVVPTVSIPGISADGFQDAFAVLDECLVTDVPAFGFAYPFFTPGRFFSAAGWWETDTSYAASAVKWVDQRVAEGVIRGFCEIQADSPDGRIDLCPMSPARGQVGDTSQLPAFLTIAYDIARRSDDIGLRAEILRAMRGYLGWWLSPVKRDLATGLISGVFEEAQGEHAIEEIRPHSLAPVDLNVAVALGCDRTVALARALGEEDVAQAYEDEYRRLVTAINELMWDEERGAYYSYDLQSGRRRDGLLVGTFDPLRLRIATEEQRDRLLEHLLDPEQFNWGRVPLTSIARTSPGFSDTGYWTGGVWSPRNMSVIAGLEESGRPDLAAELAWATIREFHGNYSEYLHASTGEPIGLEPRFAWSAAHYLEAIIEHLFGIDVDRIQDRLRIAPHVPHELYGTPLRIHDLRLPNGARLSLTIEQRSDTEATMSARIAGPLPEGVVDVRLPTSGRSVEIPVRERIEVSFP